MDYTQFILTVNSSSIVILIVLALILLFATRFRGENAYAALIIVLPNVPVYLYNMSRMLGWHEFSLVMLPISFSVNTLLMPLLWMFALKNFAPDFRLQWKHLLHCLPALFCLLVGLSMSIEERMASIRYEMTGDDTWIGNINTVIIFVQMVAYFVAIFVYIYRSKKLINNVASDADWLQKEWIWRFEALFAILFVIVMVAYAIWPRTDAWLIQILNVIAMCYLVYNSIAHAVIPVMSQPEEINNDKVPVVVSVEDNEQMKNICHQALDILSSSKLYLRPDLTLAILAQEMQVSQRLLSRSINTIRKQNFFEFINELRIEEAKQKLMSLEKSGYNIDSIYTECGFRSRSTFFLVFKKVVGMTPAQWLKDWERRQVF